MQGEGSTWSLCGVQKTFLLMIDPILLRVVQDEIPEERNAGADAMLMRRQQLSAELRVGEVRCSKNRWCNENSSCKAARN